MVLLTIDSMVERVVKDSRLEELEFFNEKWLWLKGELDQLPGSDIYYQKLDTSFFVRLVTKKGIERVMTGHVVDHPPMMSKEWRFSDRIVNNSQGGTTHLKGWYLDN